MERKAKCMTSALLLAAMLIALAGCSKKTPSLQGSKDNPVTITLWYDATATEAGPPPNDWVAFSIIREKLGINLQISALPSNESDKDVKVNAAAAANQLPDLCVVNRDPLLNLYKQGLIAEVDDMYKLMPNRTEKMYNENSRNFATFNGKCYGFSTPGGKIQKNEGVLIRKDWLDKLGLAVPKTMDDYLEVMRAFTFNDPDGNKKDDTFGFGAFLEIRNYEEGLGRRLDPIFGAFGVAGTWDLHKESAGLNIHKPEYFDAVKTVAQMQKEGLIDPNWLAYKKDDFRAAWKQGKFGIMREQNGAYAAESNYAPFDKNFPNGSWIIVEPPVGPNGKSSVGVYTIPYTTLVVSKKAAEAGKKELIAKLLEWMSSDEGYYLFGWGQEGINFVFDENHIPSPDVPDPSKSFSKAEQQPLTQLRNMVFYQSDAELVSRYPTYKCAVSGKTMSALTALREMQSKTWTACTGSDALPSPSVDLKRFYEQGIVEFVSGNRELTKENWNAWLADFDKLGGLEWEKAGIEAAKASNYLY